MPVLISSFMRGPALKTVSSYTRACHDHLQMFRSSERYLQSLVGVLCALCPVGDSRDTSSTSEAGRRLGDVGIVALPVLCPGLVKLQQVIQVSPASVLRCRAIESE